MIKQLLALRDKYLPALFIVLFISLSAQSQVKQNYPQYGGKWKRLQADSAIKIPKVSVGIKDYNDGLDTAQIRYNEADSSVEVYTGNAWIKAVRNTGGSTNSNIGSGYRLAVPGTNNIKTLFAGYGILKDSTTNANGITTILDTATVFPAVRATIPAYTAGNGLTLSGSQFKLGGTLTDAITTIQRQTTLYNDQLSMYLYNATKLGALAITSPYNLLYSQSISGSRITGIATKDTVATYFLPGTSPPSFKGNSTTMFSRISGNDYKYISLDSNIVRINTDTLKIENGIDYTLSTAGKKIMLRDTTTGLVQNIDPALVSTGVDSLWRTPGVDSIFWLKNGITYKLKDSTGGGTYTAGNGLTLSGSQFKLGGTLTENTTIEGSATESLNFNDIKKFRVTADDTLELNINPGGTGYLLGDNDIALKWDADQIYLPNISSGSSTDSVLVWTAGTGQVKKRNISSLVSTPTLQQVLIAGQIPLTGHRFFVGENAGLNVPEYIPIFEDSANVTFIGENAGNNATGAAHSNFLGNSSGSGATSAYGSNFLGVNSGYGATNANNSNFLGTFSGYNATDAHFSNFLGFNSGYNATVARYSNFSGYFAGSGATNADNSNFLGVNSGYNATNARYSNFLGAYSGYSATNANYSNFLGVNSGLDAKNASYSNLFGYNVGRSFSADTIGVNNIIIGTNISLPDDATNMINLGGIIFGTGTHSTTSGNPKVDAVTSGKIGIGTNSPDSTLHITGGLKIVNGTQGAGKVLTSDANGGASWQNVTISRIDTITIASFGYGARLAGDTASATDSSLYGSFYHDGSDTLIITGLRAVITSGDTLGVQVYYNDTINVIGSAVATSTLAVNSSTTGNSTTTFSNNKIPPGNWVWCKSPTVVAGRKPEYLSVSLIGYRKSRN